MGTRGKFGFYYKGKHYTCYNHFDSYPSFLGVHLILEILKANLDEWIILLENIREVSEDVKPAPGDIEKLEKYTDLVVSTKSTEDWYCLLRLTQGSFYHVLHAGYMKNVTKRHVYVLDLDTKEFTAKGHMGHKLNARMKLEKEELLKYARKWSEGPLDENYDPEKRLVKERKRVNWMLEVLKSD